MDIELMRADALADGASCSVQLPQRQDGREGFVVRRGDRVFGYVNRCPHTGAPLDWMPDQFLDAEKEYIICAVHGALFEIDSGRCVYGPCVDRVLESLSVSVVENRVMLKRPG